MDTSLANPVSASSRPHPLLLAAAASVTVLSLLGIAHLAGSMPGGSGTVAEPATVQAKAAPAAAPITVQQTVTLPPAAKSPAPVTSAGRTGERAASSAPARRTQPPVDIIESRPALSPAGPQASGPLPVATRQPALCRDCGIVEAVREIPVDGAASGGGAVVGGLLGGVVGNQFGQGRGRDLMTLIGIAGGAYAGNQIEKSSKKAVRHDVVVRFEDGTTQTFSSDTPTTWRSGDQVRVSNGQLMHRS